MLEKLKPSICPLPPDTKNFDADVLIATWFGSGRLRPAPGTMGSLAALPFGYFIFSVTGVTGLMIAAAVLLGVGTWAASRYGRKSGVKDDQSIVVDEVVGLWIAALPAEHSIGLWITAFFLFRLFDVVKPWPASYFDKKSRGGLDVMMDDVVAGIFAFLGIATLALMVGG